ncbi:hypothetical protein A2954_01620 [Candidatus Roizmanbacteria bacterium RIFCSPLOWO2_01_FULL_37_12]|uniref:Uncharacterized protein n=1 Tax=Candidatus Roizmanbacteria bacterium RIFCSPLOWO2_01_FULL_37_12 TaxID=1802056 RepID=A0A1F7IA05_9BACT|nr:MAG: hypothetical protein A2954_01620 [Candidatus Roizmanbacteria bacterium RIFCSPLOWO2_01_FULL_37_12]
MTNNKIFFVIIVLLVAGTALIGAFPQGPKVTSSPSNTPLSRPTFYKDFNLPSLLSLKIWPTAKVSPTSPGQPTTPPTPTATFTKAPIPSPTNTSVHNPPPPSGPSPTSNPLSGACSWMDNGLPHVNEYYPNGGTAMPATTREVCAFNGVSYYSLPFRNPNCQATQAGIDKAYQRMKTYYPTYWQGTKLLQDWKTVQQYATKYKFNPLFVISLWIEESAAGGATQATKLGCDNRRNKDNTYTKMPANSTICEQMECLFGLQSAYPGNYALYACNYRYGSNYWVNNKCQDAIGFTKGVEFWYNTIGSGTLPGGCNIQYFSGADSRCPSK